MRAIDWGLMRFIYYLTIGTRVLRKYWVGNLLSLMGLVVGFSLAMVVGVRFWEAWFENRDVPDVERIYTISQKGTLQNGDANEWNSFPVELLDSLETSMSGIEKIKWSIWVGQSTWVPDEGAAQSINISFVSPDQDWFYPGWNERMGDVPTSGDKLSMTYDQAEAMFGTRDAIGKTMLIKNDLGERLYTVAVLQENTANDARKQRFSTLTVTSGLVDGDLEKLVNDFNGASVRIKLTKGTDPKLFGEVLNNWVDSKVKLPGWFKSRQFSLKPIKNVGLERLLSERALESSLGLYMAAALMLLTAVINFVAMRSAIAASRTREMALRKVVGATKSQLALQYISETMILITLAFGLSLFLAGWMDTQLSYMLGNWSLFFIKGNIPAFFIGYGVALLIGLLASTIVILQITRVKLSALISAGQSSFAGGDKMRKLLVGGQSLIGFGLIFAASTIYAQNQFIMNQDKGYQVEGLMFLEFPFRSEVEGLHIPRLWMVDQIEKLPGVKGATYSSTDPVNSWGGNDIVHPLTGDKVKIVSGHFGEGFLEVIGLKLLAGRVPAIPEVLSAEELKKSQEDKTLRQIPVLINDRAWREFGYESAEKALNQCLYYRTVKEAAETNRSRHCYLIVGIIENITSYSWEGMPLIRPMIFNPSIQYGLYIIVRLDSDDFTGTIDKIGKLWRQRFPETPMKISFADEKLANSFRDMKTFGMLYLLSAVGSLFLTIIGLFSLARFMVAKRRREIAIRKVLGASRMSILMLMLRQFTLPLVIGGAIGLPIAWVLIGDWLTRFEVRITVEWWWPVAVGLVCTAIFLASITTEILRALKIRPAEALHYE